MRWFARRRRDFIVAHLKTFGQIRRDVVVKEFEVTTQIASADIAALIAENPDLIVYDGRAKTYVLNKEIL